MISTDPMEMIIEGALLSSGIRYETPGPSGLDFYLPEIGLHIEVKRMHSDRIGGQMSREKNVIAVQGETAVFWLAERIGGL